MDAIIWVLALYCGAGLLFGGWFAFRMVDRVDPAAAGAGMVFRMLIMPGAMALWPGLLLLFRRHQ